MGRLDGNVDIVVEADDDMLDGLEDLDPRSIVDIDMDVQLGDVHPDILKKNPVQKNARRKLEDRLEDIRLQRQITDYSFRLH